MKKIAIAVFICAMSACAAEDPPDKTGQVQSALCDAEDQANGNCPDGSDPSARVTADTSVQGYSNIFEDAEDSGDCTGTATNATCWIAFGALIYQCHAYYYTQPDGSQRLIIDCWTTEVHDP